MSSDSGDNDKILLFLLGYLKLFTHLTVISFVLELFVDIAAAIVLLSHSHTKSPRDLIIGPGANDSSTSISDRRSS